MQDNTSLDVAKEFTLSFLRSVDIVMGSSEGWKDIFNKTLRYETASTYIR